MTKKKKKKTLASTKPKATTEVTQETPKKEKKLKKIFAKVKESAKQKKDSIKQKLQERNLSDEQILAPLEPVKLSRLSPEQAQKIRAVMLSLIGVFAIGFIAWFLFGKLFRPQSLADLVSADRTIAIAEVNIDFQNDQLKKFDQLFAKYPVLQTQTLIGAVNLFSGFNYSTDLKPWLGRKVGVVLNKDFSPTLFVEVLDQQKALSFIQNQSMQTPQNVFQTLNYKDKKIYSTNIKVPLVFTTINNYLVFAKDQAAVQSTIDDFESGAHLGSDDYYQKVANNLPSSNLAFVYLSNKNLYAALQAAPAIFAAHSDELKKFKSFFDLFVGEGAVLISGNNNLVVQSFEAVDKSKLQGKALLSFDQSYRGNLLSFVANDSIFLAGGHDLSRELQRFSEIMDTGAGVDETVFKSVIEAQKQRFFGDDVSLEDDILPLFKNEYLFTVTNTFDKPALNLVLDLNDASSDLVKLEKVVTAFVKTGGIFAPKIQNVTLPDGTTGQEIIASAAQIERTEDTYESYNIVKLKIGETGWNIYYTISNNKALFSTNLDSLKKIIGISEGRTENSIVTSQSYLKNIQPYLGSADEIMNIKLGALTDALGLTSNKMISPYILPFNNVTATKNYFDDGISTIYAVEII